MIGVSIIHDKCLCFSSCVLNLVCFRADDNEDVGKSSSKKTKSASKASAKKAALRCSSRFCACALICHAPFGLLECFLTVPLLIVHFPEQGAKHCRQFGRPA